MEAEIARQTSELFNLIKSLAQTNAIFATLGNNNKHLNEIQTTIIHNYKT